MQPLLLLLLSILPSQLASEKTKDPNAVSDDVLRASVAATAKEFAGRCEFTFGEVGNTKLALHPEPILRWSNPTIGTVFGEVFVWTDNGRPAVVASWYRWFSPDWGRTLEVCSLADSRMAGRVDDVRFWATEKPGLTLKPLVNANVWAVPKIDNPLDLSKEPYALFSLEHILKATAVKDAKASAKTEVKP
jgi:hypothetical protein